MAGDQGGGRHHKDAVRPSEKEPERPEGGPNPDAEGSPGAEEAGPVHREIHAAETVVVNITARRVRIDPEAKRAQYLNRLELLIQEFDAIIAAPEGYEDIQLDAMDTLIRAVRLCYTIVRDIDVERYELSKSGKLLFNHPQGTHDDRFWAAALAVYAAEHAELLASRPTARVI